MGSSASIVGVISIFLDDKDRVKEVLATDDFKKEFIASLAVLPIIVEGYGFDTIPFAIEKKANKHEIEEWFLTYEALLKKLSFAFSEVYVNIDGEKALRYNYIRISADKMHKEIAEVELSVISTSQIHI